jgi:hypothetical protein
MGRARLDLEVIAFSALVKRALELVLAHQRGVG